VIDTALDFMHAGLNTEAARVLSSCTKADQMIHYYLAYVTESIPQYTDLTLCFPNRLEDIAVLNRFGGDWQAQYLLGCIYYDRMNYTSALSCWEKSAVLNPKYAFTWRNLAQARFDHFSDSAQARNNLERALELAPENARLVYELLQLYKNTGVSLKERLAFLEAHEELVLQRDDCALDMIVLNVQLGRYDQARRLLLSRRFNIYEGGEGKLTRLHGWLYTLLGCKAVGEHNNAEAMKRFTEALVFPKNYGEGRHYSAQEGQIHYYTGLLLEAQGDMDGARREWLLAANQPAHITDISYFAGKSLEKLGRTEDAQKLYRAMQIHAVNCLANKDLYGYYGVGMPSPLPFELNIQRQNSIPALLIKALAETGLGEKEACVNTINELISLDAEGEPFMFYRTLGIL
jgi:tetratricopeptide (TPR) repeat protein